MNCKNINKNNSEELKQQQEEAEKNKKRKRKLPENEAKLLHDLTVFPNLAAMLQAEAIIKEKKALKKKQEMKLVNGSRSDDVERKKELLLSVKDDCPVEKVSTEQDMTVEFSRPLNVGETVSPSLICSTARDGQQMSGPHELREATQSLCLAGNTLPIDNCHGDSPQRPRLTPVEAKSAADEENVVLQKLLRGCRYFDGGFEVFNLGGRMVKSAVQLLRKPCYVCGHTGHTGSKCRKLRTCHKCKARGHLAEDCPKGDPEYVVICLRCGESGHDLFSCSNEYPCEDLKNIRCYLCNEFGHLCCSKYDDVNPTTVSCYNCGESSHSGLLCPKPLMDKSRLPSLCRKCGEEGHKARKCGKQNVHVEGQIVPTCIQNPKDVTLNSDISSQPQLGNGEFVLDSASEPIVEDAYHQRHKIRRRNTYKYRRFKKRNSKDSLENT